MPPSPKQDALHAIHGNALTVHGRRADCRRHRLNWGCWRKIPRARMQARARAKRQELTTRSRARCRALRLQSLHRPVAWQQGGSRRSGSGVVVMVGLCSHRHSRAMIKVSSNSRCSSSVVVGSSSRCGSGVIVVVGSSGRCGSGVVVMVSSGTHVADTAPRDASSAQATDDFAMS